MKSLFLSLLLVTTGCSAFFNIGDSQKGCNNNAGFPCTSVYNAWNLTDDYQLNDYQLKGKNKRDNEVGIYSNKVTPFHQTVGYNSYINEPQPILEPAKVARIWINSYTDENNNVVFPSKVFSEITPRTWNMPHERDFSTQGRTNRSKILTPLIVKKQNILSNNNNSVSSDMSNEPTVVPQAVDNTYPTNNTVIPQETNDDNVLLPPLQ